MSDPIDDYFAQHGKKMTQTGQVLHDHLVGNGCDSYIKTIYIGYEIDGNMVAALYAHADHIEIALALDEDDPDSALKDASHLTWRTLPLSFEVWTPSDAEKAALFIDEACNRIKVGTHAVLRDNEHFVRSRETRRGSGSKVDK
jgi:hypothetical protein